MIAKWKVKAIIQKVISYLPKKEKINFLFQKYITKGVYLTDAHFECKIIHARDHIKYFEKYSNRRFDNSTVLELGTGWYPVIPIALYLNDFKKVVSIDIQSWMTKESQLTTIKKFQSWRAEGKLDTFLPCINEEKWEHLMSILEKAPSLSKKDINKQIKLFPSIRDARKTNIKGKTFDFICSNNTFEHIPSIVLMAILKEFDRLIKKGGVMSHFIDMTDHFAHFDESINIYNFLKYSEKKWQRIDNSIQPQNRMRFVDYKKMYELLSIPVTDEETRGGEMEALKSVDIHPEYKNYSLEELAVSHGYLVSQYSVTDKE